MTFPFRVWARLQNKLYLAVIKAALRQQLSPPTRLRGTGTGKTIYAGVSRYYPDDRVASVEFAKEVLETTLGAAFTRAADDSKVYRIEFRLVEEEKLR